VEQQAELEEGSGENYVEAAGQGDGVWLAQDEDDRMSAAMKDTTVDDESEGSDEENEVSSHARKEGTTV
jgi:hypothetical protein